MITTIYEPLNKKLTDYNPLKVLNFVTLRFVHSRDNNKSFGKGTLSSSTAHLPHRMIEASNYTRHNYAGTRKIRPAATSHICGSQHCPSLEI